ncbi:alternate-type signal peptide domain-containing protein [Nocardioides nematodiphilus]|uniref:alternate-type signal peptide domain-containing protein n=1 Tax=Nocardioides nematodiphilus TaxID=2849669 RepID=UPI001CD91FCF|nr:alternate-type signal peptide domain-containing protein [Nocardioides nematodiphilus]MCA1982726.1 alternate-type signal peptide domain-containing protein [Nocardioides nematodiphilus]
MSSPYAPRHRAATRRRTPRVAAGAVAAAVALVLLLGGQGSFATWATSRSVAGGSVKAGTLSIGALSCGSWQLIQAGGTTTGAPSPNPTTYTNQVLQPNDVLTLTCTTTLTVTGEHQRGTLALTGAGSAPAPLVVDGTLSKTDGSTGSTSYPIITVGATAANGGAHTDKQFTDKDDGATVSVLVALSVPNTNTANGTGDQSFPGWNATQLSLTATQVHS